MTVPTPQAAYLQSYGVGTLFPTVIVNRAPTTNDFNGPSGQQFQVTQRWIDSSDNYVEWMLVGFTSTGGYVQANWVNLSQSNPSTLTVDCDSGSASPISGVMESSGGTTGLTTVGSGNVVNLTGTLNVSNGGTGAPSLTAYSVMCGGTTSTSPVQSVASVGSSGQVLTSNGAGSLPTWQNGASTLTITTVTHAQSPYTVLSTDQFLAVNSSGGDVSILLPNAPTTGRVLIIKDSTGSATVNNITVTTVGGVVTIDGLTSYVMNINYQSINVVFDSTSYEVF